MEKVKLNKYKPRKPRSIAVIAREWTNSNNWDAVFCNTLYKFELYVDGKLIYNSSFEYGYGSDYMGKAFDHFRVQKALIGCEKYRSLNHYCREKGIEIIESMTRVGRKRDL